jgi:oligo-1,6-glucosidase
MTNCRMASIEEYNDISTKNEYANAIADGCSEEEAMEACYRFSRDNARTPMQWDASPNGGFTAGKPWLKVNPNYKTINVAQQETCEESVLNYYKKLIALRKSEKWREIFTYGDFTPLFENEDQILSYSRCLNGNQVIVVANFSAECKCLCNERFLDKKVLLSNGNVTLEKDALKLMPSQVVVLA